MRFDEPELMVDAARFLGEEVGRIVAADGRGLSNRLARRLSKRRERRGDREYVLVLVGDAQGIGDEEGAFRRDVDRDAPTNRQC